MQSSKSHLNLLSLCAHLDCPLEACVLCWLLLLDPRGTEWPAKIKARFSTPLIESHTLDFRCTIASWSSNPKANLSDHAELKWIYPAAPRTCWFRVIEVGVRCFWARTCVSGISHHTSRACFLIFSVEIIHPLLCNSRLAVYNAKCRWLISRLSHLAWKKRMWNPISLKHLWDPKAGNTPLTSLWNIRHIPNPSHRAKKLPNCKIPEIHQVRYADLKPEPHLSIWPKVVVDK